MSTYKPNILDFGLSFIDSGFSGLKQTASDLVNAYAVDKGEFVNYDYSNYNSASPASTSTSSSSLEGYLQRLLDSSGAQIAEAQKDRDFQARQAAIAMNFEAQQAAINREFQISSAREAMDFESREAEILRQWQEAQNQKAMDYQSDMSNTSYQRAVKDLKAAGLNPILAYTQGGSSSHSGITSSGAFASGKTAAGSSASGHAGKGSQANVRGQLNELSSAINDLFNSAGKIVTAFF